MLTASDALKAWLPTARESVTADLYTITLVSGQVLRWTSADRDIVYGGNTYSSSQGKPSWSTIERTTGLEVGKVDLTIADDGTVVVGGLTVLQAIALGVFDGAAVSIDELRMPTWGDTSMGTRNRFSGRLAQVTSCTQLSAQVELRDYREFLDTQMPRNLFQASCQHTLYDAGCTLSKAAFTATGSVGADSTSVAINPATALGQSDGYYAQGILTFTGGQNSGLSYAVKSYVGGVLTLDRPALLTVATGDTFSVSAGCDKTAATCKARFNNLVNFAGQPYIPAATTAI